MDDILLDYYRIRSRIQKYYVNIFQVEIAMKSFMVVKSYIVVTNNSIYFIIWCEIHSKDPTKRKSKAKVKYLHQNSNDLEIALTMNLIYNNNNNTSYIFKIIRMKIKIFSLVDYILII